MVIINFSPVYTDRLPTLESVSIEGYAITINGATFDFSPLEKGYELSVEAIDSPLFADKAVMSAEGVLSITLLMPYDEATATEAIRFPAPVTVTTNGPVDIPTDHPAQPPVTPTVEDDHGLLAEQENLH
ncbi:hypothetical protein QL104_06140 [Pseudomonas piscis]|uniref:Adhesin n=1 Tax=Pseudomonas piscis TaxID=2614538 RepID=A0ABY9NKP6_9PSED|nr:hypothetical protein [Pseudomonas piscis]WMN18986.1 hypothetical protein QL104_06140 [Pseudomonas piscis]